MLSFDIRALESRAVLVDGQLAPDDPVWQEGDPKPAEPVRVTGRLSSAGPGRYYLSGRMEGEVALQCRRCLGDAAAEVVEELHLFFADAPEADADGDPDVYRLDPRAQALDLRPAIREQWLLGAPAYALCREGCKGLCTQCGADLNAGACGCTPMTDRRWDAMRSARGDAK